MATVWVCPACGEHNALDAPECASCGRWPSVFDLERTVEVAEPGAFSDDEDWLPVDELESQPEPAPAPEPETAPQSVFVDDGSEPIVTTDTEPEPDGQRRRGGLPRWVIPVAIAAFVAIRALLENV